MLAASLLALVVAAPYPATRLELCAKDGWYGNLEAKEEGFVGLVERIPPRGHGIGNFFRYRLWTLRGGYEIVGDTPVMALDPYDGTKVLITGKLTGYRDELDGYPTIAAARLELLPFDVNDRPMLLATLRRQRDQQARRLVSLGYDSERDEEVRRAMRYRNLDFIAELHRTGHHLEALSGWPALLPGPLDLNNFVRNPLEMAALGLRLRWLEAVASAVEEDLSRAGPPHCNGVGYGCGGIMQPNVLLRGEPTMHRTFLLTTLTVLGVALTSPGVSLARDEKQPEGEDKRVYVVMIRSEPQKMYVLEKTKVQKLGDMSFLTGRLAGTVGGNDWRVDATMWFPLTEITQMTEYASLADVKKWVIINR
jgi:hypothetical protein